MTARLLVLIVAALGLVAVAAGNPAPGAGSAMRQQEPRLRATVEALQTQVADQDDRITRLEDDLSALGTVVAVLTGDPGTRIATPAASPDESYTIRGWLSLLAEGIRPVEESELGENFFWTDTSGDRVCIGSGGFDDLGGPLEVVVSDGAGETLAVSSTDGGEFDSDENACVFFFRVDVPRSEFYDIRVGQREGPTFTFEELEAENWEVRLSIG